MTAGTVRAPSAGRRSPLRRVVVTILLVALAVVMVRGLVVQSFVIPTSSMRPTLVAGDRILVSRSSYLLGDVHRGDVVVFDAAGVFEPEPERVRGLAAVGRGFARLLGVPVDERTYVKRVIGLPGERVACCDAQGRVTVDGTPLAEPYLAPGVEPSTVPFDIVVPRGRLWVMGDNRGSSGDSRAHLGDPGGGTVPQDRIVGRAIAVYWPPERVGRSVSVDREEHP